MSSDGGLNGELKEWAERAGAPEKQMEWANEFELREGCCKFSMERLPA
jgi:hypothetical protein